jgi:hypothetical protein
MQITQQINNLIGPGDCERQPQLATPPGSSRKLATVNTKDIKEKKEKKEKTKKKRGAKKKDTKEEVEVDATADKAIPKKRPVLGKKTKRKNKERKKVFVFNDCETDSCESDASNIIKMGKGRKIVEPVTKEEKERLSTSSKSLTLTKERLFLLDDDNEDRPSWLFDSSWRSNT